MITVAIVLPFRLMPIISSIRKRVEGAAGTFGSLKPGSLRTRSTTSFATAGGTPPSSFRYRPAGPDNGLDCRRLCNRIRIAAVLACRRDAAAITSWAGRRSRCPSRSSHRPSRASSARSLGLEPRLNLKDVRHRAVVNDVLVNVVGDTHKSASSRIFASSPKLARRSTPRRSDSTAN